MIGELFGGRYRLDAELGRGGIGVVYRAYDTRLGREVALKVLSGEELSVAGRERLLSEARSAAQLNHPNIVSVYDAGEESPPGVTGTCPFVVMELVEGPSLFERRPADLAETLATAVQICAALEHAHANGIVHRDLKPENVLLAPDGTAKLNDFGLARSMASRLSVDGTITGTVFYLAPELALGREFDARADLYALGVMLYELLVGELPFVGDDPIAVISQHLHAPPIPPRARNPDIPPALDALILRLLAKRPDDRPGSAAEVRAALVSLALGEQQSGATAPAEEPSILDRIVRGRLVGRERELAQARVLWQRAAAGEGHVLLISGEPGVGKTRLVRELITQVQVSGATALQGECYAERGAPYAPFAQIVDQLFGNGIGDRLGLPGPVMADLLALAPGLRSRFPQVVPNPPLDPQAEQQRLFEHVVALCAALSERAPLLLVVEDAQWSDSGSLALLRHLARRTRRRPVLLVVTYREMEIDAAGPFGNLLVDLNRERLASRLKLSRLGLEGTRDLLATLFAEEISPAFLDGIYAETEGNPFFIEEVCKALVESGKLTFADGRWHRPSVHQLGIPQSVRMAIQSRVGRLPQSAQEVLQLAALLGSEFAFGVLAEASELSEDVLVDALEAAERAQLIEERPGRSDIVFGFAHALIPATLAEGVHALRRRRLHRRVALALERLRPGDVEGLAHHWTAAGDEGRALHYSIEAGARASASYANAEAERYFGAALELADAAEVRARLLEDLGRVLARQSRYEEAIGAWKEGIGLYQALGDADGTCRLYTRSARAAWYAGDTPRGLAICREGLASVAGAPESEALADLLHETARACYFNGLPGEAGSLCYRALAVAERLGSVRVQAEALTTLGGVSGLSAEESIAALTRAVDLAEDAGLLPQASRAHHNLGYALSLLAGDFAAARAHYLRAAELSRQRGAIVEDLFSRAAASDVALYQGELALAAAEQAAMRQVLETVHDPRLAASFLHLSEALLWRYRGEVRAAADRLETLRAEARAAGDLQLLSWMLQGLVDALLEHGREAEAAGALQEAIALEERFVAAGFGTRCRMALHHARQGRAEAARQLLSAACHRMTGLPLGPVDRLWLAWAEAGVAAAERHWPEALAAYDGLVGALGRAGMRWYRAQAQRDQAEALLSRGEAGDREEAQRLLRQVEAEFQAIGAPFYAGQARRRLEELWARPKASPSG